MDEILSPEDLAAVLGCTPETIEESLRNHRLPGVQYGRSWRLPRSAVLQALHDQAMKNLEPEKPKGKLVQIDSKSRRRTPPLVAPFGKG